MNFISETKFNAPIKGCLPSTQGNDKGDLRIDSNLQLLGNLCEDGSFSITEGIRVGVDACGLGGVTIGNFKGCGCGCNASGMVQGSFAEFNDGNFQNLNICTADLYSVCSFNEFAVYDKIRFTQKGSYGSCYWTFGQALDGEAGFVIKGGKGAGGQDGGRMSIDSDGAGVYIDNLHIGLYGETDHQAGITLKNEKITSWSELKKYVGGGTEQTTKIQRFTSPALPANCSKFYFEGDETVTGTELPFIQVRETATGKLFQMDVWVNLNETCTAYTLGKPIAEVEPCTSAIDAGKWTAIVMN